MLHFYTHKTFNYLTFPSQLQTTCVDHQHWWWYATNCHYPGLEGTHCCNVTMSLQGYQSQAPPQECAVVNAITKAMIPGRDDPIIFKVNYATLIDDKQELELLVVLFEMMKHGIKVDMIPPKDGGTGAIHFEGVPLPYQFDDEKLFWTISKPTQDDLDTLTWVELNYPEHFGRKHLLHQTCPTTPQHPMARAAMLFSNASQRHCQTDSS